MKDEKLLPKQELEEIQAFKHCFGQFYTAMLRKASMLLKIPELSEDAVQEVFISLWESRKLNELTSVEAYLNKCLKNRCLNILRSRKREILRYIESQGTMPVSNKETEEKVIFNEMLHMVEHRIESLSPVRKEVLKMKLAGATNHEIAKKFNISENTVKVHYNRANRVVRSTIEY
ncbi:MAG: sigma-70 family RNA polymerase sigma factor [Bacteroidota bacterium]